MPHEYKPGEVLDGTQEGPVIHGMVGGASGTVAPFAVGSGGALIISGLVPDEYDYIALSYTGTDVTGVVYKTGGSGGTTVATLVLAYTSGNLTSVTKT